MLRTAPFSGQVADGTRQHLVRVHEAYTHRARERRAFAGAVEN
jgi:hypothetical protein